MLIDRKQAMSGAFLAGIGIIYGGTALSSLPLGEVFNMGPGFFPVMLSGMLVVIGLVLIVQSILKAAPAEGVSIPWRPIAFLTAAIVFFASALQYVGLLPAVFIAALLASYADRNAILVSAAITSLVIAIFCAIVFVYGLRAPIPVFGTLFQGKFW